MSRWITGDFLKKLLNTAVTCPYEGALVFPELIVGEIPFDFSSTPCPEFIPKINTTVDRQLWEVVKRNICTVQL